MNKKITRRDVLRTAALGVAGVSIPFNAVALDTYLPDPAMIDFFAPRDDARPWVGDPVLIKVESTDGVAGFGQVRPPTPWLGETTDSIVAALRHYYGPALIGANALERELLGPALNRLLPSNSVALAGIDMALHDLVGKTYGLPVYALLGGTRRSIPLDWSISLNPLDSMVAEAVRAVSEFGVRTICLKMGPSARWEEDIATFKRVRSEVGPSVEIGIDPNEGYDLSTTLRVVRSLENERVAYVEQPMHRDDHEGLRLLRAQGAGPMEPAESTKFPAPPPAAKPDPPTLPPDEIIRRFAAKEDEMITEARVIFARPRGSCSF